MKNLGSPNILNKWIVFESIKFITSTLWQDPKNKVVHWAIQFAHFNKNIRESITSNLPFLVVYSKDHLSPNEITLLNRSEKISENAQFVLYKISKSDLLNSTAN